MKKILISRTDRIGDLILTTPLINEIKKSIKDSFIAVLVSDYAKEVLYNNPDIDLIFTVEDKKLYEKIKKENFDTAIIVYPRFKVAAIIFFAGIEQRIGTAYRWFSPLFFNTLVKIHRKNSGLHEADLNLLLVKDIIGEKKAKKVFYFPTEAERIRADEYIVKIGFKEKFIMIFIGGRGSADNLSPEKYAELSKEINKKAGRKILISYGIFEEEKIKRFMQKVKHTPDIHIMENPMPIRELAALIEQCEVFISGSTGPMHIAAALDKKTLSFFPVKGAIPSRWAPIGNKAIILQQEKNKKMDDIPVDLIIERLKILLEK
ncbi:MAG: glycosyltransferase family 9 protein [Candidatus Goldbacteria bacterium]|nr:glycosyltransferase family 9 protein [Candidatus Goldiibacteriota bacterium]